MNKWVIGGVPEHFNVPWQAYIAATSAETGGRRLTWREFPGGTGAMVEALGSGEVDVALLLTEGAAAARARGADFGVVATYVESPLIWGVHVAPASRYESVADLAAARFAISRFGSGSHLMAIALANERGWRLAEEQFVVVGSLGGAIEAFADARADVFLWERFMTQPIVDRGDFRRVGEFVAPWPAFVVCASPAVCAESRPELEALIVAVCDAAARFAEDPATPQRLAQQFGIEPEAARAWLRQTRWAAGLQSPDAGLAAAARVLEQAGVIGEGPAR